MVTVGDIVRDGWSALPALACWTLATWGLAKALFRGFVGQELRARIEQRQATKLGTMRRAQWELRSGKLWTAQATKARPDLTKLPELSSDEINERHDLLRRSMWTTVPTRAALFLLACPFCQAFWSAVGLTTACCLTGVEPKAGLIDCLATCLVLATASLLIGRVLLDGLAPATPRPVHRGPPGPRSPGCESGDCD